MEPTWWTASVHETCFDEPRNVQSSAQMTQLSTPARGCKEKWNVASRSSTWTVLFTDLAGSTELRSGIGETTFRVLRHRHDGLLSSKGWLLRFQRARSHGRRLVLRRPSLP
jgi:hypothetical protein